MEAIDYFAAKLRHEIDPADLVALEPPFVLLDVRDDDAWKQGHIPHAQHVPRAQLDDWITTHDTRVPVVVHCWGPGCNGATKAALRLSQAGIAAREMIGGFEYWVREGLPHVAAGARAQAHSDPLTAVTRSVECGC
ncbi:rhodanese-like domain-containing protein [Lolliginicoccus suaedae]|uniref:rhodanese-like domain-containing protein n=1 Tax=Lolliginicoccus suaedae TaxID=2605429 RepID=UPI001659DC0B|nr:rhodanese-like domain-containing protein [Lolliginicoccus suaedae]